MDTEDQPVPKSPLGNTIKNVAPKGYYTRKQAADEIDRTVETLRRWQQDGTFVPTHYMQCGQLQVNLYSTNDIKTLRKIAATKKRGRPRKDA
jgi:DNA-binding transcriptional MerR regulator